MSVVWRRGSGRCSWESLWEWFGHRLDPYEVGSVSSGLDIEERRTDRGASFLDLWERWESRRWIIVRSWKSVSVSYDVLGV